MPARCWRPPTSITVSTPTRCWTPFGPSASPCRASASPTRWWSATSWTPPAPSATTSTPTSPTGLRAPWSQRSPAMSQPAPRCGPGSCTRARTPRTSKPWRPRTNWSRPLTPTTARPSRRSWQASTSRSPRPPAPTPWTWWWTWPRSSTPVVAACWWSPSAAATSPSSPTPPRSAASRSWCSTSPRIPRSSATPRPPCCAVCGAPAPSAWAPRTPLPNRPSSPAPARSSPGTSRRCTASSSPGRPPPTTRSPLSPH